MLLVLFFKLHEIGRTAARLPTSECVLFRNRDGLQVEARSEVNRKKRWMYLKNNGLFHISENFELQDLDSLLFAVAFK